MNINSTKEADALAKLQRVKAIQNLEGKISRLYFIPAVTFLTSLIYLLIINILDKPLDSNSTVILLLTNIFIVGQATMQRSDYIRELIKLDTDESLDSLLQHGK